MIKKLFIPTFIFLSVLTGLVYVAPQWLIWKQVSGRGLEYLASQYTTEANELEMDLPRAREIYDGHWPPSDLFSDHGGVTPLNPLPVLVLSIPMFLARGNINIAYLLNQFLFSILVFFGFYLVGFAVTKNRLWGLFSASLGALSPLARYLPRAFYSFGYFMDLLVKNFVPLVNSPQELLFLHKVVDPLITFIFYLPALAALITFWLKPKKSTAILCGALTGVMFYVYWHYWVYLVIVLGLLGIYSWFTRKTGSERFRWYWWMLGSLILVAIPYFINYFSFNGLASAKEVIARLGVMEYGRHFQIYKLTKDYLFYLAAALVVYFIFWRKKADDRKNLAVLFWAFLAAIVIAWNVQLVTGFNLTANHWWLAFAPAAFIMLIATAWAVAQRIPNSEKAVKIILVVLIGLLFLKKIINAWAFAIPGEDLIKKYSFDPNTIQTWSWMNANLPGEPKIVSPALMDSVYLTIYTASRPYLPFYANTLMSDAELEDRFLNTEKLFGVSADNLEKQLRWESLPSGCDKLAAYFHRSNLTCDGHTRFSFENGRFLYGFENITKGYSTVGPIKPSWPIPENKIQDLLKRYRSLKISWKDLGVDYVYYGPWDKNLSSVDLSSDKNLELVYKSSGSEIYRIK